MEGPTPVSALIHAATMVTAGVYLLIRLSPLIEYSGTGLLIISWVGGLTALFAASIATFQNDLKRVIAYSTCSQLGWNPLMNYTTSGNRVSKCLMLPILLKRSYSDKSNNPPEETECKMNKSGYTENQNM